MRVSYLISVTTSQMDIEVMLAILNIAGKGQSFYGFSNGTISTNLWIIPNGKGNKQEVTAKLQAIPGIQSVSIVALSNPVSEKELTDVRELFAQIGWDASSVADKALLLFIDTKLQGQYTYYIDHGRTEKGLVKINIKPIEEHPDFSPDWLKSKNNSKVELPDKEFSIDDIEVRSIVIEEIEEEIEPPPPPPNNKK